MLKTYFINTCIQVFKCLQKEYSLNLIIVHDELTYYNSSTVFSVCFDRAFDIYVCFRVNNNNLYLYDMMKQLDFEEDTMLMIKRNQVSSRASIDYVLNNLQTVMQKILYEIKLNPNLLCQCLDRQQMLTTMQLVAEKRSRLLQQLDTAWKEKRYSDFVYLFELNENLIEHVSNIELFRKRALYAQKILQKAQQVKNGLREPE